MPDQAHCPLPAKAICRGDGPACVPFALARYCGGALTLMVWGWILADKML
ncbi:hypothetical protein [Novosphingobium sp.]